VIGVVSDDEEYSLALVEELRLLGSEAAQITEPKLDNWSYIVVMLSDTASEYMMRRWTLVTYGFLARALGVHLAVCSGNSVYTGKVELGHMSRCSPTTPLGVVTTLVERCLWSVDPNLYFIRHGRLLHPLIASPLDKKTPYLDSKTIMNFATVRGVAKLIAIEYHYRYEAVEPMASFVGSEPSTWWNLFGGPESKSTAWTPSYQTVTGYVNVLREHGFAQSWHFNEKIDPQGLWTLDYLAI
jgi:hypothetical protein